MQLPEAEDVRAKVSVTDALAAFGHEPARRGRLRCPMPGHEDRHPGASVYMRNGTEHWFCFVCDLGGDVIDLIQLTMNVDYLKALQILAREFGLLPTEERPSKRRRIPKKDGEADWTYSPGHGVYQGEPLVKIETYHYRDEDGTPLFDVLRYEPKTFRQRPVGPDGKPFEDKEKRWKMAGVKYVLYRMPEIAYAVEAGLPIYVVEGERDVHAAMERGLCATCNPGGAGKWRPEYSEALRGATVIVVPDKDPPGLEHARMVSEALEGISASVEIRLPVGGLDLRAHFEAGLGIEDLAQPSGAKKKRRFKHAS